MNLEDTCGCEFHTMARELKLEREKNKALMAEVARLKGELAEAVKQRDHFWNDAQRLREREAYR